MLRGAVFTLITIIVLGLLGCSSDRISQPESQPAAPVSSFFGAQPVPDKVDAELWRRLVSEFDKVLAAQGTARRTSVPPTGTGSDVADLWAVPSGGGADLCWTYRNQGDLNLDGSVTIADLTPIGVHYLNSSTGENWIEHQIADADCNGVVSITDLTPIGVNFGGKVMGYELQVRFNNSTEWVTGGWSPFIESPPGSSEPPCYTVHLVAPLPNLVYRVVPTANDTEPYIYGVASNEVLYGLTNMHFWSEQSGGPQHDGRSPLSGPMGEQVAWTLELAGTAFMLHSPVADAYGTTYTTTSAPNPGGMEPGPGTLYAVDRFGQLQWSYRSAHAMVMPPIITMDNMVVVQEEGGDVLGFSRDGTLKWQRDLTGTPLTGSWGMTSSADGTIVASDAEPAVYGIQSDSGILIWSQPLPDRAVTFPTIYNQYALLPIEGDGISSFDLVDGTAYDPSPFSTTLPVIFDGSANILITDPATDVVGILGLPMPHSFVPAEGEIYQIPVVLGGENYAICSVTETDPAVYVSRLSGFNGDGVEAWSRHIFAGAFSPMALDIEGRLYLAGITSGEDRGVYCVNEGHNIVWHYSTGELTPGAVCPAYNNLLVFHQYDAEGSGATTLLTGIGAVEPPSV